MEIEYLDDVSHLETKFINKFLMSWDEFQIKYKDWINQSSKKDFTIDKKWYDHNMYMWEKIDPKYPNISMKEACDFLRKQNGILMFITENGKYSTKSIDYIAKANAGYLADRIEYEWNETYRLAEENRYLRDTLPADLYVFDSKMEWSVFFTHETLDWDADDPIKEAESRCCFILKM